MLSKRQKAIIKLLLSTDGAISGTVLAGNFNITTRTLRSDVSVINSVFLARHVEIHANPATGYWIPINERKPFEAELIDKNLSSSVSKIYPTMQEERLIMLFYFLISSSEYQTMESFSKDMYVSKTTISKDIKALEEIIEKTNGIHLIVSAVKGIKIKADNEFNMRTLISDFIALNYDKQLESLQRYLYIFEEHTKQNLLFLHEILKDALQNQNILLTDKSLMIFAFEITLYIQREKRGFFVQTDLRSTSKISLPLSSIEQLFLFEIHTDLLELIKYRLQKKRRFSATQFNGFASREAEQIFEEYAALVEQLTTVDLRQSEEIKDSINAIIFYGHTNANVAHVIVDEIRAMAPYAYIIASYINPIITQHIGATVKDSAIASLALRLISALEQHTPTFKTIIVCNFGRSYALFLKYKLKIYFPDRLDILEVTPYYGLESCLEHHSEATLILSTLPLPGIENIPILHISPLLNDTDVRHIRRYMEAQIVSEL